MHLLLLLINFKVSDSVGCKTSYTILKQKINQQKSMHKWVYKYSQTRYEEKSTFENSFRSKKMLKQTKTKEYIWHSGSLRREKPRKKTCLDYLCMIKTNVLAKQNKKQAPLDVTENSS